MHKMTDHELVTDDNIVSQSHIYYSIVSHFLKESLIIKVTTACIKYLTIFRNTYIYIFKTIYKFHTPNC